MTIKQRLLSSKSKNAEQRRSSGLTTLQVMMALESERSRPITCTTSKRLGRAERGASDAPVQDSTPDSVNGGN